MRIKDLPYDLQVKAEKLAQAYVDADCLAGPDTDYELLERAAVRARIDELQEQKLKALSLTTDWRKTMALELINAARNGATTREGLYDAKAVAAGIKLLLEIDAASSQHPLIAVQINSDLDGKIDDLIKQYAMPY